ncbi:protein import receptor MAS20, partial [Hyphopichia burtonii NRRL Y-1933]
KAEEKEEIKNEQLTLIREALKTLDDEQPPVDINGKENYFMEQVSIGEKKATEGSVVDAALCFYKALEVYPNPTDILGVYQKTVPQDVYEAIIMMIALRPPASISNVLGDQLKTVNTKPTENDLD